MLENFAGLVLTVEDVACRRVLGQLAAFFGLSLMLDENWEGQLDRLDMAAVRNAVGLLGETLRPEVVALVDAFDIPDRVLNSTIGRYDGNVYEALYEAAKKSELNRIEPFDGYHEFLQPRLDKEFLKLGNKAYTGDIRARL